jgi:hypothetical protein
MRISILDFLTEAHHEYDSRREGFSPLKKGDTVRVFHGFREPQDAMRVAKNGLSGAARVPRVYSYEADNNPKGLFVSVNIQVAKNFVGAYGVRTIVEFNAHVEDLDTPVWPNGSYTVQGQMASYFGHGHEGARNRREAQRNARQDSRMAVSHIRDSDDPALAMSIMSSTEMQALFVGHLDPHEVTCFWVEGERDQWEPYSVSEYIAKFGEQMGEEKRDWHRLFTANENFDGDKFLEGIKRYGGQDVETALENLWFESVNAPQKERARRFLRNFESFLWPKQYIPCMQWMAKRFGKKSPQ